MRSRGEEVFDKVVFIVFVGRFAGFHTLESFAAASLGAVFAGERPFDVATVGNGDEVGLIRNEVDHINLTVVDAEIRLTRGRILLFHFEQLILDDLEDSFFSREDVEQVLDAFEQFVVLVLHFLSLEANKLVKAEFKNVIDLLVGEGVASRLQLQAGLVTQENAKSFSFFRFEVVSLDLVAGFIPGLGIPNHLDEVIEIAEGKQVGFELLGLFFCFTEKVAGASQDDLAGDARCSKRWRL